MPIFLAREEQTVAMGTHAWVAVYDVVLRALNDDVGIVANPPTSPDEVEFVAETLADHIVEAFVTQPRQ